MSSLDRRLDKLEDLQLQRDIAAVCREVRDAEHRFDHVPGYAALVHEYTALVQQCDAEPPVSYVADPLVRAYVSILQAFRLEHGMEAATPGREEEWVRFGYRWQVTAETPEGREYMRRFDALVMGENITDDH